MGLNHRRHRMSRLIKTLRAEKEKKDRLLLKAMNDQEPQVDGLFVSSGQLVYGTPGDHLYLMVDRDIVDYYRALFPKYIKLNRQKHPPHISVVRNVRVPNLGLWGKYEGAVVEFRYSPIVHNDGTYYWLNAFSKVLEKIRLELGLTLTNKRANPPAPWIKCFHVTIGNTKERT